MPTFPLTTDPHQLIADFAAAKKQFAVITILRSRGSVPRSAGTKAIVDAQGAIWGTIGGGQLEAKVRQLAVESIASQQPKLLDFPFAGDDATENVPVCGGAMLLLIDPTAHRHADTYARAAEATRSRRRVRLLTSIAENATQVQLDPEIQPSDSALTELLLPPPRLLIVGGGHVGQALARQAHTVGFEIILFEDRPEFASPDRFPASTRIHTAPVTESLASFPTDVDTYIALVSRGHLVDSAALAACIHKPAAFIGMMGSRRKIALLRKHFLENHLATEADLARLHAPIGLDIGAETVEEVAASIVAQLISIRRKAPAKL